MADYVQYHHPNNPLFPPRGPRFMISTSRRVKDRLGDRIWLITRTVAPRHYVLVEWFIADRASEYMPLAKNELEGRGVRLDPFVPLDEEPWFPDFLHTMGNFGRGFSPITERRFIEGLERAAGLKQQPGHTRPDQLHPTALTNPRTHAAGQGFGDPIENRLVEQAAIAAVGNWYRTRGWQVDSVESERRGYDLVCTQAGTERHVEVKGVSGEECVFLLTAGEVRAASTDPRFVLALVLAARKSPVIHFHDGAECLSNFDLEPVTYRATLRR